MRNLVRIVALMAVAGALVLTATLARPGQVIHAQEGCDAATLTGSYTISRQGEVYDNRGYVYYLAQIGVVSFDGAGNVTGSDTFSADGNILKRKLTGSYTVSPECTGTLTLRTDNTEDHADLVISTASKEIDWIQTDVNFIFSGKMKKQLP